MLISALALVFSEVFSQLFAVRSLLQSLPSSKHLCFAYPPRGSCAVVPFVGSGGERNRSTLAVYNVGRRCFSLTADRKRNSMIVSINSVKKGLCTRHFLQQMFNIFEIRIVFPFEIMQCFTIAWKLIWFGQMDPLPVSKVGKYKNSRLAATSTCRVYYISGYFMCNLLCAGV